jgi:hypothetical protein
MQKLSVLLFISGLWFTACNGDLSPTNPFDPDTPLDKQQKAVLSGHIVPEVTIDLTQVTILAEDIGVLGSPDAAGNFTLDVTPGPQRYLVNAPLHEEYLIGDLLLGPGDERPLGDLKLKAHHGAIIGTVLLADRATHTGTVITAGGTNFIAVTSPDGSFLMSDLPIGSYQLLVYHEGYNMVRLDDIEVVKDQSTAVNATLNPSNTDYTINGGAEYTNIQQVTLELYGQSKAYIQASEYVDFSGADWENFDASAGTHPFNLSTGDGLKQVYVRFSEDMLDVGDTLVSSIILDATSPETTSFIIGDDSGYATNLAGNVTLFLTAFDSLSGVDQMRIGVDGSLDDEEWQGYLPQTTVTLDSPSVDGLKTIEIQFKDVAGNMTNTLTDSVVLDTEDPTATFSIQGSPAKIASRSVILEFSNASTDVSYVRLSNIPGLPDATAREFEAVIPWELTVGDGPKFVYVELIDQAGRVSTPLEAQVELDTTGPAVPDLTRTNISDTSIDLTWTTPSDADLDHFELQRWRTNETGFTTIATPASTATSYSDSDIVLGASHNYRIFAVDDLGNWSAASVELAGGIPMEPVAVTYLRPAVDDGVVRWNWPLGTSLILGSFSWEDINGDSYEEPIAVNAQQHTVPAFGSGPVRYNQKLILRNINPDFSLSWESEFQLGSSRKTSGVMGLWDSIHLMDAQIDSQGDLHLLFQLFEGDIIYDRQDGQSTPITLSTSSDASSSSQGLALDSTGAAHVVYKDGNTRRAIYRYIPAGINPTPEAELILDDSGNNGTSLDIAVDSFDIARVAYFHQDDSQLMLATVDGDCRDGNPACPLSVLDATSNAGDGVAIAVDNNDLMHLAYNANVEVYYLKEGELPHLVDSAAPNRGDLDIATDPAGTAHISYIGSDTSYVLNYARCSGPTAISCEVTSLAQVGNLSTQYYQKMILDRTGSANIVYYDYVTDEIRLAVGEDACFDPELGTCPESIGLWSLGHNATSPAIALGAPGYLHVVFSDIMRGRMNHVEIEKQLPSVFVDTVADAWGFLGILAGNTAVKADNAGIGHVAYDRVWGGDQHMYYRKMDGVSPAVVVDNSGDQMGTNMSIDVDSSGTAHISYVDRTIQALKYASLTNNIPSLDVLDSDQAGCNSKLVLDSNQIPRITYCAQNQMGGLCTDDCPEIRYLELGNSPISIHTPQFGAFDVSMSLGAGGLEDVPWVSWVTGFGGTEMGIEYLVSDGVSQSEMLNSPGGVAPFIAVDTDSNGDAYVAYFSLSPDQEGMVLHKLDPVSEPVLLAKTDDVGFGISMAFGPDDIPHLVWCSSLDTTIVYLRGDRVSKPMNIESVKRFAFLLPQTSIDVDADDNLHITFFSNRNGMQMRYIKGKFATELIPVRVDKL